MKIAVIGGGSTYTPELVEGFARRQDALRLDELILHDTDAQRLRVVAGVAERILHRAGYAGRLRATTDLLDAVDGASAVLVQLRVGGQRTRLVDETLPPKFGLVGQETTGPGGFAKALRTVPVVLDIAERVAERAAPGAWILDFTNPVGIVTRALLDAGHRALGLCNVAIGLQRRIAGALDVPPEQVRLGHAGLNHLTWLRSISVDEQDRTADLLAGDLLPDGLGFPRELIRTLGAVPSYYLRYYYSTEQEVQAQRQGHHRALEVIDIEERLLAMYADPTLDRKPALLEQRGGAYYSEAAAALVTSLFTGDGARHYVNLRNAGTVAGLPGDAVVEVPVVVDGAGVHPDPVPPFAPELLGLMQAVTAYEVLTIEAARTGDADVALRALIAHPLVREWDLALAIRDELFAAHAQYLPQFAGAGTR